MCAAHKTHQIATSLWSTVKVLQTGLIKTLQVLKAPGMYHKFVANLMMIFEDPEKLIITRGALSEDAVRYREEVMALFIPAKHESLRAHTRITILTEKLLSGDWRSRKAIEHRCVQGCCASRSQTLQKFRTWIPKMLRWLQLRRLEMKDWRAWHRATFFMGFLAHVHGIFADVFLFTFTSAPTAGLSTASEQPIDDRSAETDDGGEAGELAQNVRAAVSWWQQSDAVWVLYLVRQVLQPQVQAMESMLASSSSLWDLQQAFSGVLRSKKPTPCH